MAERLELYGPWFASMKVGGVCKSCHRPYIDEEDSDESGTGLCYDCFENALEDFEERRRARIARENEY